MGLHDKKNETISILTQTNEEAVIMLALLHSHGIKAKLVQSMDGLRFLESGRGKILLEEDRPSPQGDEIPYHP